MVIMVGWIQMLFLEGSKGVSGQHQGWTEAVAGGTMALVSPATDSLNRQESGRKGMHQVGQVQEEGVCQDGIGQQFDALIIGAEGVGYQDGIQWYIEWSQFISLGTTF